MENNVMTQEEMKKEVDRLLNRYVQPHRLTSREVKDSDIERVQTDAKDLFKLTKIHRNGRIALALAHSQIDDTDPLRFFVFNDGRIMINPVILRHVNTIAIEEEGCLSYPDKPFKYITRFTKLEVQYDVPSFDEKKIIGSKTEQLRGKTARIFQHELDHLDGKNIYEDY